MRETIQSGRLSEQYVKIKHSSGLTMLLYPMQGFSTSYALFGTNYGSVDNCFKTAQDADFIRIPDGVAHFLEHKLFESEDGDAFSRYAKTGASANAYTSFDRTCYLFACADHFEESMEILLDFVTKPYFTQETVQKEQGIIGQEITMYDDNPDWRVFFNLLSAMYVNNPVRIDIAGTKESIAQIDAELLYKCYNTFYNLNNMVLAVAGNFEIDTVVRLADKILKPAPAFTAQRKVVDEPDEVGSERVEIQLPVATPLFHIGFKAKPGETRAQSLLWQITDEVLLETLAGETSPLYRRLYDEGLINSTFSNEVMSGPGYYCCMFSGESRKPYAVLDAIKQEIERLHQEGVDRELFECAKRAAYGRYIGMFVRPEAISGLMTLAHFSDVEIYELMDAVADLTYEQVAERLKLALNTGRCSISVVSPPETEGDA